MKLSDVKPQDMCRAMGRDPAFEVNTHNAAIHLAAIKSLVDEPGEINAEQVNAHLRATEDALHTIPPLRARVLKLEAALRLLVQWEPDCWVVGGCSPTCPTCAARAALESEDGK